jgi:hypothetical protein
LITLLWLAVVAVGSQVAVELAVLELLLALRAVALLQKQLCV